MQRLAVLSAVLVSALLVSSVVGHAGFADPLPYGGVPCQDAASCGNTVDPCNNGGDRTSPAVLVVSAGSAVSVTWHVAITHANVANTFSLTIFPGGSAASIVCSDLDQSGSVGTTVGNFTAECTIPMGTVIDPATGYIQSKFNATAGGGSVYYYCTPVTTVAAPVADVPVAAAPTEAAPVAAPVEAAPTEAAPAAAPVEPAPVAAPVAAAPVAAAVPVAAPVAAAPVAAPVVAAPVAVAAPTAAAPVAVAAPVAAAVPVAAAPKSNIPVRAPSSASFVAPTILAAFVFAAVAMLF